MFGWLQDRRWPQSMRQALTLLTLAVFVPLLLVQTGLYWAWYASEWSNEERSNLEIAQRFAAQYLAFIRDIQRQEFALGSALDELHPESVEEANQYLAASAAKYPAVRAWHWVAMDGRIAASSDPQAPGRSVAEERYFRRIAAGQTESISSVVESLVSKAPTIYMGRLISDAQQNPHGVMLAAIEPTKLDELTLPIDRPREGTLLLFDRRGRLAFASPANQAAGLDWGQHDWLLKQAIGDGREAVGSIDSPIDGRQYIAARVPVGTLGWVAGAGRPASVAMAEVREFLWVVAGLNVLVVTVSAMLAAAISAGLIDRLRRLQAHARAIGEGILDQPVRIRGIRELENLAAAFNAMAADLGQARREQSRINAMLEQRVQGRTAELATAVAKLQAEVRQRTRAEQTLREQSRMLDAFFEHALTSLAILDRDFNFIRVNEAYAEADCRKPADFPGRNHFELYPSAENEAIFREVVSSKTPYQVFARPFAYAGCPERGVSYWDWTLVPILDADGEVSFLVFSLQNVTQVKEAERRDSFTRRLLEPLVRKATRKEYLYAVLEVIRDWSGCRCAGIRVRNQQGEVPYESAVGFSAEFMRREGCLSLRGDHCACTRIIRQTPEAQEAGLVTPGGSFRCDNVLTFVGSLNDAQRSRYRGTCAEVGFASLALIPIRYRQEVLGAIHLADERPGMVSPEAVEFLESMMPLIGEAIHRFNAETEAREASLYARSLIEAGVDPLVVISPEGLITDVNQATEQATGVPRKELVGSDFSAYFIEIEKANESYRKVLAEGRVKDYPLTIRHVSGCTTDVLYNATVYRNEAGEVQGVLAAARDITDRKRAEEAVQAERQRFNEVLEILPIYVILLTPDHRVPFANRFFRERFGESKGKRCYEYLFGRDEPCEVCETFKVLKDGQSHHWEWTGPDGREYDIFDFPFKDADGSPLILEMGIDITERNRAQRELARHRDQLEEIVAQRTEELARSNSELEQFAYVASHDLQEPLRVVTGYAQLLEQQYRGLLDAEGEEFMNFLVDGVRRMQQLITDLLSYSRVGSRGRPPRPADMEEVLERALENLRATVDETGAVVSHDSLPTVAGDPTQLVQLLQNLIGNAIKFRGDRRPEIHLSAQRDGDRWRLAVRDNGIGIEPRYWEQIFEIFQRLHTRRKYPGTGMGLAICKKIIDRHHGRIWLDSTPGEGTTFYFTLEEHAHGTGVAGASD